MIKTMELTKKIAHFGNGTVGMRAEKLVHKTTGEVQGMLLLNTIDKTEVGSAIEKNACNIDNAEIVMIFNNIQGLDALLHILNEIKEKWEKTAEC